MAAIRNIFILLGLTFMSYACSSNEPTLEEFIGPWITDDNATIEFNGDSTFSAFDLSGEIFGREYTGSTRSGRGKWNLSKNNWWWILDLKFNREMSFPTGYSIQLYIAGENGVFENKPPWYLFFWMGDPDNNQRYIFKKQQVSQSSCGVALTYQ